MRKPTRFFSLLLAPVLMFGLLAPRGVSQSSPAPAQPSSVGIIGDSLVSASPSTYLQPFLNAGIPAMVDGVGSRALRYGWQCRNASGRLVVLAQPTSKKCRREGLEVVRHLATSGTLPDVLVIALGTNDAGLFKPHQVAANLAELRSLIGERQVFLVSVKKLTSSKKPGVYNAAAAAWCASDSSCAVIDWASSPAASNRKLYSADRVHLTSKGVAERAQFIFDAVTNQMA
jgi:lysophospholipase L1-like esterase